MMKKLLHISSLIILCIWKSLAETKLRRIHCKAKKKKKKNHTVKPEKASILQKENNN
ncbi:hypothetical protein ABFS82_06G035600 [Erythranthe guttata]